MKVDPQRKIMFVYLPIRVIIIVRISFIRASWQSHALFLRSDRFRRPELSFAPRKSSQRSRRCSPHQDNIVIFQKKKNARYTYRNHNGCKNGYNNSAE